MYSLGYFGQATGTLQTTASVGLGPAAPRSKDAAEARHVAGLMQISLNKPPPTGVSANIAPLTHKFDAQTKAALKALLRAKGQPDQVTPGMWTRLQAAAGLSEAGAKQWEGAIAFYNGFDVAKSQKKFVMQTPTKMTAVRTKTPIQRRDEISTLPGPPICSAGSTPRQLSNGRWICEAAVTTTATTATAEPATPAIPPPAEEVRQETFVTYPDADADIAPLGPAPWPYDVPQDQLVYTKEGVFPEDVAEKLKKEKRGLPVWGWVLIAVGGAAALGGGIWLGIRAKRGG